MSRKGTGRRNGRRTRLGAWARADYDEAGTVRRLTRASATAKRRLRRARDSDGGRRLRRWAPVAAIAALALAGAAMLGVGASGLARASTMQAQTAAMRREASQLRRSAGRPSPKAGNAGAPARKDKGGEAPAQAQDAVGEAERRAVQAATDAQNGPGDPSAAMQALFPGVDRSRYQGFAISPLGRWNQGRTPCSWTGWPQDALGAGDHRVAFVCIAGDGHARGMASAVWTGLGFTDFDARINGVGAEQ